MLNETSLMQSSFVQFIFKFSLTVLIAVQLQHSEH